MANETGDKNLALFCDFENVALGVRDAKYAKFDIKLVLERLLLKGSIVTKKAYCDWDRYKTFKPVMHEAAFELIEIPHTRQSGKNSADIRMVVDALDLCYMKEHIDTFVIISGDSDFSPLVSKLRENAKTVIGVGVKNSTSDLLIANCDEFIYYDDLVREKPARKPRSKAAHEKPDSAKTKGTAKTKSADKENESRAQEGIRVIEAIDDLSDGGNHARRFSSISAGVCIASTARAPASVIAGSAEPVAEGGVPVDFAPASPRAGDPVVPVSVELV